MIECCTDDPRSKDELDVADYIKVMFSMAKIKDPSQNTSDQGHKKVHSSHHVQLANDMMKQEIVGKNEAPR